MGATICFIRQGNPEANHRLPAFRRPQRRTSDTSFCTSTRPGKKFSAEVRMV